MSKIKIEDINLCFVQLAFHAQNATIISNIVKFNKNFDFLSRVFCGFKIKDFLKKYYPSNGKKDFEAVQGKHETKRKFLQPWYCTY